MVARNSKTDKKVARKAVVCLSVSTKEQGKSSLGTGSATVWLLIA
jgi:hypothetical protein